MICAVLPEPVNSQEASEILVCHTMVTVRFQMATIRKRNERWQVQIRKKDTPTFSKTFISKNDALSWARRQERLIEIGEDLALQRNLEQIQVRNLITRYEQQIGSKKKSYRVERYYYDVLRRQSFSNLQVRSIKAADIQAWVDEMQSTHKASSIHRLCGLLNRIFLAGINYPDRLNLMSKVIKPAINSPSASRIDKQSMEKLLNASTHFEWLVVFALETGLRQSEIADLKCSDIDADKRLAYITNTKNGHHRYVPLSGLAVTALNNSHHKIESVFGMSSNAIKQAWKRLCKSKLIVDVRFHDLRHEAISRFFERGLTHPEVAAVSGHRTVSQLFWVCTF